MYSKRFILDVLDERHKSLSGGDNASTLKVPFGTEYKVFLKNDNDFDCAVDISVDGIRPLGYENGKPNFLILPAHQKYLFEGWFNKDLHGGTRFKFMALDSPEAKSSGRVKNDSDNGIIKAIFYPATKRDPYAPIREEWRIRLKKHEDLRREFSELQDELERLRMLRRIQELEDEIERHRQRDRWNPWKEPWMPSYPKYQPIWLYEPSLTTGEFDKRGFSEMYITSPRVLSRKSFSANMMNQERSAERAIYPTDSSQTMSFLETTPRASTESYLCSTSSLNQPTSDTFYSKAVNDQYETQEGVTEKGSRHYDSLNKVDYEVGQEVIATLQIQLLGFHLPETPVVTSTSTSPSKARYCVRCGHMLGSNNFKFCPMCGSIIPPH